MYLDCGTNFIRAQRHLEDIHEILNTSEFTRHLLDKQISWHFNPPSAPHIRGIWEASGKSAKTLLQRVIQDLILKSEKLNTILHRIEENLNLQLLG